MDKPNIVITGFDIFRDYKVNPSWEAVKSLKWDNQQFNLIKVKVPVTYEHAKKNVKMIWKEYNPVLVVHVGVSHLASCLTLEDCAVRNKHRYILPDVENICLSNAAKDEPLNYLKSTIDIDSIVDKINQLNASGQLGITACRSSKAGEYLCEYIYRCSLKHDPKRTLFVHVPQLSSTIDPDLLGKGLKIIIESILELHIKQK